MTTEESYHAFLLKHRGFCEYKFRSDWSICGRIADTVRNFNGKDFVLCHDHASRLDAVRTSDRKQIPQ